MRQHAKVAAAGALCHTGVGHLVGRLTGARRAPFIASYHRVVEDVRAANTFSGMCVSRAMLERHLDWLARSFELVSLDDAAASVEHGGSGGRPLAAVCFDDGYHDVYEHAVPLLLRKGIPAAVFVVTDLVDTPRLLDHDRLFLALSRAAARGGGAGAALRAALFETDIAIDVPAADHGDPHAVMRAALGRLTGADVERVVDALEAAVGVDDARAEAHRILDWETVVTMHRAGFTIGSHSGSHAVLTQESPARVAEELILSRVALEARLGAGVAHFAYPGGAWDGVVLRAMELSGYRFGYTVCRHRDPEHPLFTIVRTALWEGSCAGASGAFSPSLMCCHANGILPTRAGCRYDD